MNRFGRLAGWPRLAVGPAARCDTMGQREPAACCDHRRRPGRLRGGPGRRAARRRGDRRRGRAGSAVLRADRLRPVQDADRHSGLMAAMDGSGDLGIRFAHDAGAERQRHGQGRPARSPRCTGTPASTPRWSTPASATRSRAVRRRRRAARPPRASRSSPGAGGWPAQRTVAVGGREIRAETVLSRPARAAGAARRRARRRADADLAAALRPGRAARRADRGGLRRHRCRVRQRLPGARVAGHAGLLPRTGCCRTRTPTPRWWWRTYSAAAA